MPYDLSNSSKEKLQFTPFWGGSKPGCSDGFHAGIMQSHNFFCLRSYPGEISHSNSPHEELSDISDMVMRRRKGALHTSSHLTLIEGGRSTVPPLRRVVEFRARYWQIPIRGIWGLAKFGDGATYGLGAISVCTHTHTCTNAHGTHPHKAINIYYQDPHYSADF